MSCSQSGITISSLYSPIIEILFGLKTSQSLISLFDSKYLNTQVITSLSTDLFSFQFFLVHSAKLRMPRYSKRNTVFHDLYSVECTNSVSTHPSLKKTKQNRYWNENFVKFIQSYVIIRWYNFRQSCTVFVISNYFSLNITSIQKYFLSVLSLPVAKSVSLNYNFNKFSRRPPASVPVYSPLWINHLKTILRSVYKKHLLLGLDFLLLLSTPIATKIKRFLKKNLK